MTSGGARLRSGPPPDPESGRSERRGYNLRALPATGYSGRVPAFPLDDYRVYLTDAEGGQVYDEKLTRRWRTRERKLWRDLWKSPQACAWSMPQFAYMIYDVALYCRQLILCQDSTAKAADRGLLPRYADRIGLSAVGLSGLGWRIASDDAAQEPPAGETAGTEAGETPQRRLRR